MNHFSKYERPHISFYGSVSRKLPGFLCHGFLCQYGALKDCHYEGVLKSSELGGSKTVILTISKGLKVIIRS